MQTAKWFEDAGLAVGTPPRRQEPLLVSATPAQRDASSCLPERTDTLVIPSTNLFLPIFLLDCRYNHPSCLSWITPYFELLDRYQASHRGHSGTKPPQLLCVLQGENNLSILESI